METNLHQRVVRIAPADGQTEKLTSCTQSGQNRTGRGSKEETNPLYSEMVRISPAEFEQRNSRAALRDGQNRTDRGSKGETHGLFSEMIRIVPTEGHKKKLTNCTQRWSESHRMRNWLRKLPVGIRVKCQEGHFYENAPKLQRQKNEIN